MGTTARGIPGHLDPGFENGSRLQFPFGTIRITRRRQGVTVGIPLPPPPHPCLSLFRQPRVLGSNMAAWLPSLP